MRHIDFTSIIFGTLIVLGIAYAFYGLAFQLPNLAISTMQQAVALSTNTIEQAKKDQLASIPEGTFQLPNTVTQPLHAVRFDTTTNQYQIDYLDSQNTIHTATIANSAVTFEKTTGTRQVSFHDKHAVIYVRSNDKITQYSDGTDSTGLVGIIPMFFPIPAK